MNKKILNFVSVGLLASLTCLNLTSCGHKHTWSDADCTTPKTCSDCHETEGEALGHTWGDADCTTPKTCSVCGETEGEALGHTWKNATCKNPKICSVCGETEGKAKGHTWKKPTCKEPKTCSDCGATEGSVAGHTWKDATCTQLKTCSVCGKTEGSLKKHTWENATCQHPKTCSVCGKTEGSTKKHTWENATCQQPKTCSACGETEGSIGNHSWIDATYDAPKTCSICGETEGDKLEPTVTIRCPEIYTCASKVLLSKWVDNIRSTVKVDSVEQKYYSLSNSITVTVNLLITPLEGQVGLLGDPCGWDDQNIRFKYSVKNSKGVIIDQSGFSIRSASSGSVYSKDFLILDLTPGETYDIYITGDEGIWHSGNTVYYELCP